MVTDIFSAAGRPLLVVKALDVATNTLGTGNYGFMAERGDGLGKGETTVGRVPGTRETNRGWLKNTELRYCQP